MLTQLPFPLVLASSSPRRIRMLEDAGLSFTVMAHPMSEDWPASMAARDVPTFLAEAKATAIRPLCGERDIILGADTLVLLEGEPIGKPSGTEDAIRILGRLAGRMHEVITGVCILQGESRIVFADRTEVYFNQLKPGDIRYYVERFLPLDKAGAYAIQEWIGLVGISRINGNYFNVVGLPMSRVIEALQSLAGK